MSIASTVTSVDGGEHESDEEAGDWADDEEPPVKAAVQGLHTRFLLEAFLSTASLEIGQAQSHLDHLLKQLGGCAAYLGLGSKSKLADQLGVLSVLRDFGIALGKCAFENDAREADAARQARQTRPRSNSTPSCGTSANTAPAPEVLNEVYACDESSKHPMVSGDEPAEDAKAAMNSTSPKSVPHSVDSRSLPRPSPARDYTESSDYF